MHGCNVYQYAELPTLLCCWLRISVRLAMSSACLNRYQKLAQPLALTFSHSLRKHSLQGLCLTVVNDRLAIWQPRGCLRIQLSDLFKGNVTQH